MKVLLVSSDPKTREQMALTVRSVRRLTGEEPEFVGASDGIEGIRIAQRIGPDVVVADEIASRAGAFALTQELKGGAVPFDGRVVILLEREQDEWLAAWSGADAWFVKPVDPFALADTVAGFVSAANKEPV